MQTKTLHIPTGRRLIYDSETLSHSEASGCEHLGCLINLITCLRNQVAFALVANPSQVLTVSIRAAIDESIASGHPLYQG